MAKNTYTGDEPLSRARIILYGVALGRPYEEIADKMKMKVRDLHVIVSSPMMQEELERVREEVRDAIRDQSEGDAVEREVKAAELMAIKRISQIAQSADDKTALSAAIKILDLGGRQKPQRQEIEHVHRLALPERQAELLAQAFILRQEVLPEALEVDAQARVVG